MSTESPSPPTPACVRRCGAALLPAVATVMLLADQASKLWIQQRFATCDDNSLTIVPGWLAFAYTCNKDDERFDRPCGREYNGLVCDSFGPGAHRVIGLLRGGWHVR